MTWQKHSFAKASWSSFEMEHQVPEALLDSDYLSLLRYLSFSVLDNRLLADNLSQLPKVSIWLRKGWEEVFVYFYLAFGLLFLLRFDSDKWDLTQNSYTLLSRSGICPKYALFWSPFLLRFDSDKWDSTQTWLRYLIQAHFFENKSEINALFLVSFFTQIWLRQMRFDSDMT